MRKMPEEGAEVGGSLWVGPEKPLPLAQLPRRVAQVTLSTQWTDLGFQRCHINALPTVVQLIRVRLTTEVLKQSGWGRPLRRSKMGPVTFSPRGLGTVLRRYPSLPTTRKH